MSDAATGAAQPLAGVRVLDLTEGIAGAYCTKLLTDAGADVVKIERPGGDPLRARVGAGAATVAAPDGDGALFRFLHTGHRSVVATEPPAELVAAADIVVTGRPGDGCSIDSAALFAAHPQLIVVSITPYGTTGPLAGEPDDDLLLQTRCSSIAGRGEKSGAPVVAGGQLIDWTAGATAAVCAIVGLRRRDITGLGDHVDVSKLEVGVIIFNGFRAVSAQMTRVPKRPSRIVECPSIEPAKDGWVGVCTLTGAQFASFADMIGKPEWADDPEIKRMDVRNARPGDLRPSIAAWTTRRSVAEAMAEAAARRIPTAPVGNGAVTPTVDHFVERGVFVDHPDGTFRQPRVPYRYSRTPQPPFRPAPALGNTSVEEVTSNWVAPGPATTPTVARPRGASLDAGPLAGIRVFDMTSFWAGSYASQIMAFFGADVIKVESVQRPDGTRLATSYSIEGDQLWERAPLFQSCNTNKRDITLDLSRPEGRDLARRLLAECDVLIENYTPRVLEGFDIVDPARDDLIVVRMPAWGLSGPWRDLPGFAQSMEQATGLAWMTGFSDGPPILPRGPCDPIGGLHGAFATIAALRDRDRTGLGQMIEAPLVEPALNVAAEQFVERSAYGRLLERQGNRSNRDAPHGVFRCSGDDRWLAVAVEGDAQWRALRAALANPAWSDDERFDTALGRLAAESEIDAHLAAWCAARDRDAALALFSEHGVPAAPMVEAEEILDVDQITHRSFYETLEHPVIGSIRLPGFPARLASHPGPIHRHPAPLLGQHNREVFAGLLGLTDDALDTLTAADVIGTRPVG